MKLTDIQAIHQDIADNQKPLVEQLVQAASLVNVDLSTYDHVKFTKVVAYIRLEFEIPTEAKEA